MEATLEEKNRKNARKALESITRQGYALMKISGHDASFVYKNEEYKIFATADDRMLMNMSTGSTTTLPYIFDGIACLERAKKYVEKHC